MSASAPNVLGGSVSCMSYSGLAAGTTTTLTWLQTDYRIYWRTYRKAAGTAVASPTSDFITGKAFLPVGAGQSSVFVVGFNAAGDLQVSQGTVGSSPLHFPNCPDTFCPIGYVKVSVATGSANWVFGTNNNSGVAGTTYEFVSLGTLPARPIE